MKSLQKFDPGEKQGSAHGGSGVTAREASEVFNYNLHSCFQCSYTLQEFPVLQ